MSNSQATFAECIASHGDTPLLIHDKHFVHHDGLLAQALSLRANCPDESSYSVAIQTPDPLQLILGLVAMDGYAQKLLILPPCTSPETTAALCKQENITHLLNQQGFCRITNENQPSSEDGTTNWLFLTSGTTGDPKVLSHTFAHLASKPARHVERAADLRWGLAYQAHRFAGIQVILQALISGRPLVLSPSSDAATMAEEFVEHKVTALSATPSQWRQLLSQGRIRECKLRQITLGGEIADQAILSALQRAFPESRIVHIYASTEAGVGFSVSDGLAGFPREWLNTDRTVRMKQSSQGTLMLRGSACSTSNTVATELDSEGYLDTSDSIELKGERVYFLGRATGVINVGGNKVHPEEVERLVRELPGIQDARVTGKKSPIMGQIVALEVEASEQASGDTELLKKQIRDHCREQLPNYKIPAMISVVSELPVNDAGKIDRKTA